MSTTALVMVLLSAVAHAGWNFLFKRAHDHEAFVWWAQVAISVLFLPIAVFIIVVDPIESPGWIFVVGTGILHAFYFLLLGRSYARGDLSQVYPIARGTAPALTPILGVLLLGETISPQAIGGVIAIVLGIFVVFWWGRLAMIVKRPLMFLKEPATLYALATGLFIVAYSIWDKEGVRYVDPVLYMYLMALGTGILLTPYILKSRGLAAVRGEWRMNAWNIVAVGVLVFAAYGLVLSALAISSSKVSYVWPVRESGIVIGVLLGSLVLKEPFGRGRVLGSCLIVLGVAAIALAP